MSDNGMRGPRGGFGGTGLQGALHGAKMAEKQATGEPIPQAKMAEDACPWRCLICNREFSVVDVARAHYRSYGHAIEAIRSRNIDNGVSLGDKRLERDTTVSARDILQAQAPNILPNPQDPMQRHLSDRAFIMSSLVSAMRSALNWHDRKAVAEAMRDVWLESRSMQKEIEYLTSDVALVGAQGQKP
jgi:hypothetical protein